MFSNSSLTLTPFPFRLSFSPPGDRSANVLHSMTTYGPDRALAVVAWANSAWQLMQDTDSPPLSLPHLPPTTLSPSPPLVPPDTKEITPAAPSAPSALSAAASTGASASVRTTLTWRGFPLPARGW